MEDFLHFITKNFHVFYEDSRIVSVENDSCKKVTISCVTLVLLYSICTKGCLSLEKLMTDKNILS